jgi:hypothetical protein
MCGDIAHNPETGQWELATKDKFGMTFDRWVVEAATALYYNYRQSGCGDDFRLLVTGGSSNSQPAPEPQPTIAEVYARELVNRGVKLENILQEPHAQNSLQQLQLCARILGSLVHNQTPQILAVECHIPRLFATLQKGPGDFGLLRNASFVCVEDVLLEANSDPLVNGNQRCSSISRLPPTTGSGVARGQTSDYGYLPVEPGPNLTWVLDFRIN